MESASQKRLLDEHSDTALGNVTNNSALPTSSARLPRFGGSLAVRLACSHSELAQPSYSACTVRSRAHSRRSSIFSAMTTDSGRVAPNSLSTCEAEGDWFSAWAA